MSICPVQTVSEHKKRELLTRNCKCGCKYVDSVLPKEICGLCVGGGAYYYIAVLLLSYFRSVHNIIIMSKLEVIARCHKLWMMGCEVPDASYCLA
jgi:hypothetical protein